MSSSSMYLYFVYLFLTILPLFNDSIKVKLVHFDSVGSPHHRKYNSPEERYQLWTELSARRLQRIYDHLLILAADQEYHPPTYHTDLRLDSTGIFLASVGVGTPARPQLLALDTGSTITWVTCVHSKFQAGDYNYLRSRTYSRVGCDDYACEIMGYRSACSYTFNACTFQLRYASSAVPISGPVVNDIFTFWDGRPNGESKTLSFAFGCGFLDGPIHPNFTGTGVLGLSPGWASIVTKAGQSFSYCIGNIYNTSYEFNSLTLGEGITLLGDSTPILYIDPSSYVFVNLQSISVDGEVLAIDPRIFIRDDNNYDGGTIFDTGSAKTYLADDAYMVLNKKLMEKMKPVGNSFCFSSLEPDQVPVVRLIFEGGATLTLGIDALFGPHSPTSTVRHCFNGILPTSTTSSISDSTKLTLIGINAQQHHNIGYDYRPAGSRNGRIYMSLAECDTLPA